jgi:cystathionine beta-lyase family protein involved in aluminum resistance
MITKPQLHWIVKADDKIPYIAGIKFSTYNETIGIHERSYGS